MRLEVLCLLSLIFTGQSLSIFGGEPQPRPTASEAKAASSGAAKKELTKQPEVFGKDVGETTPILFQGRHLLVQCTLWNGGQPTPDRLEIVISDLATGKEVTRFGKRYGLASAFVEHETLHVFASESTPTQGVITKDNWFQNIHHFSSTDLKTWKRELAVARSGDEHLLNSSICRDGEGYLMAYESDKPVQFCFKFARSVDLKTWKKVDGLTFAGVGGKEYSACPVIRYSKPFYYVIYLHAAIPGHKGWVPFMARSKDLAAWELSPNNPVLEAGKGEGVNNSDIDLIEIDGKTYVYYCTGNQETWANVKRAVYPGPMREFFESYFSESASMTRIDARVPQHP
jgi:hypothetical protein